MTQSRIEPGQQGWVEQQRMKWTNTGTPDPISMIVIEYWGDGDPAFGGSADDRTLAPDGQIHTRETSLKTGAAEFRTLEEAHEACKAIPNRRPGSLLGVAPSWR